MDVQMVVAWTALVTAITGGVAACLKYGIQLAQHLQTTTELIATILERVHALEGEDPPKY